MTIEERVKAVKNILLPLENRNEEIRPWIIDILKVAVFLLTLCFWKIGEGIELRGN